MQNEAGNPDRSDIGANEIRKLAIRAIRLTVTAMIWIGMISTAWLAFVTLIGGLFSDPSVDYWQNLGNSIIGASTFVPPFALLFWLRKKVTRSADIAQG